MNIQSVLLLLAVIASVAYVCWRLFVKRNIKTCCGDVNGKCSSGCEKCCGCNRKEK
jgi:hypothetical protein